MRAINNTIKYSHTHVYNEKDRLLNSSFRELAGFLYGTERKYVKAKLPALPKGGMSKTQMGRRASLHLHFQ